MPHLQIRGACWPARSVGTHLHAAWRWNVSRPGDPTYAVSSAFRHNPRRWRPALHQGDHTQLDRFWSEMRCRGVLLLASRISVPSPATPCTLFTPSGAPHGLISLICLLPFTGADAGACLRMGTHSHLSILHLVSHTDALYTRSPLRVPTRAGGQHRKNEPLKEAYSTPLRRTTSCSAATAPTVLHAASPPSSHVGAEQASSCCGCSDARMAA